MNAKDRFAGQIANLSFLEALYQDYLTNPQKVDPSWAAFFDQKANASPGTTLDKKALAAEVYRLYGHLAAHFNPLEENLSEKEFEAHLQHFGLSKNEGGEWGAIYGNGVGFEFKGGDPEIEKWIQEEIEGTFFQKKFTDSEKKEILSALLRSEILESFLHTKHVGKKRFSLEGAETLIPMLCFLIAEAANKGTEEIVMGMSHRGRLNVLANILGKPLEALFKDFDEEIVPSADEKMGDVRYHKGYFNEKAQTIEGKPIILSLASNPSHLESVDPVVQGKTKAKQVLDASVHSTSKIMPLLIHGDAALAGQGVVYETLQLSRLKGYGTGGTLHFVVNNQVGFTTTPKEGRSTRYCTDIAHTFDSPIFHVNAEDPENAIRAALLALKIRNQFGCDLFLDLNSYRKYGHNEGDEPLFTQPIDYRKIKAKKSISTLYGLKLMEEKVTTAVEIEAMKEEIRNDLQSAHLSLSRQDKRADESNNSLSELPKTAFDRVSLLKMAKALYSIPSSFHLNPKLDYLLEERLRAIEEEKPLDWGNVETLTYGSILFEGNPVRLSGQDSGRGTFSHRHARLIDQQNETPYHPLAHLRQGQGRFDVLNSSLSEIAVLGFEYGYSTVCRRGLTIWEAQFGDFANSAQVIIDQYIASGEEKWGEQSGVVLLLPHGFEGQGPEHSSARLERFLSLSGHNNWVVANVTTPAQFFHLLRYQAYRIDRKPLILMTPKGLLRHPSCVSHLKELTEGSFLPFLDDPHAPKMASRLVFCSGRIYYDLAAERVRLAKQEEVALVRIEQLYPLEEERLKEMIKGYKKIKNYFWVQEEPENMGGWSHFALLLPTILPKGASLSYIGRERSATPATGYYARHKQEHSNILRKVFEE